MAWIIAVIFLIFAVLAVYDEAGFVRTANGARATVLMVPMGDIEAPALEFFTANNRAISVIAPDNNLFFNYREGLMVDVLYDPGQPEHVKLRHFFLLWGASSFFLLLSLASFTCAWLLGKLRQVINEKGVHVELVR